MAIQNFEFPGVTLTQVFEGAAYGTTPTLGVACVGSMYRLHRYDVPAEAAKIDQSVTAYDPATGLVGADIPGRSELLDETVDAAPSTHHLKIVNGIWAYPVAGNTGTLTIADGLNKVLMPFAVKDGNGYTANAAFGSRGVKEGDPVVLSTAAPAKITVSSTVYSYVGETEDSSYAWINGTTTLYTESTSITANTTKAYTDSECSTEAGTITAYSAAVTGVTVSATVVAILIGVSGKYDTLVVDNVGTITTASTPSVTFCVYADASFEEASGAFAVNVATDKVTVYGGLVEDVSALFDAAAGTVYGSLQGGDMYLEYRERLRSYVGQLGSAASASAAAEILGAAVPDNPLSMAVYFALQAAGGNVVYFTAVRTEDSAGYTEALDFLTKYSNIYCIVPATSDTAIIQSCAASVINCNTDATSKVRRSLWYGINADSPMTLYTGRTTAVAASGADPAYITFTDKNIFVDYPAQAGDIVVNNASKAEYKIVSTNYVNRASVVPVDDGTPAVVAGSDLSYSLVRTSATNAQTIQHIATKLCTQNLYCQCIWGDEILFNGDIVDNFCGAAAAAGMRSAEECWRPLSNLQYNFFSLKESHGFTRTQLKELGAHGIWIIANNDDGIPINMKAITTAASNNVNTDNESIVANANEIALALCRVGEDMVGNSNISDTLLTLLADNIKDLLDRRLSNATSGAVGNQLLSYQLVNLYQDPANLDEVYAEIEVEPPKPFNRFHMTMRVI